MRFMHCEKHIWLCAIQNIHRSILFCTIINPLFISREAGRLHNKTHNIFRRPFCTKQECFLLEQMPFKIPKKASFQSFLPAACVWSRCKEHGQNRTQSATFRLGSSKKRLSKNYFCVFTITSQLLMSLEIRTNYQPGNFRIQNRGRLAFIINLIMNIAPKSRPLKKMLGSITFKRLPPGA